MDDAKGQIMGEREEFWRKRQTEKVRGEWGEQKSRRTGNWGPP